MTLVEEHFRACSFDDEPMLGFEVREPSGLARASRAAGIGVATHFDHVMGKPRDSSTAEAASAATYEGTMSHGLLSGEGTLWYRNGDEYAGELHRGARHGTGTLTRSDGQALVGRWEHDEYLGPRVE